MNRKRNRPEDWGDLEPSPVVHVSELPEHTLEIDLLRVFEQYGSIRDITMIPQKGQALIEYDDLAFAEKVVAQGAENFILVSNHRVRVNYSTSKRIVQRPVASGAPGDSAEAPIEGKVLLLTIYNAQYPITVDVINQITMRHGRVARIVIFKKSHLQAMVEFKNVEDARNAKRNLNGADIYSGCCTLKVEFARPTRLTVTRNDQDTWDFENPNQLPRDNRTPDNTSLLGRFFQEVDHARSNVDDGLGHGALHRQNHGIPYNGHGGTFVDNLALAVNPGMVAAGRPVTPVVMVYNVDAARMNCDNIFNLLCLYGNVVRIKFLRTKEGSAMAQLGDIQSVERAITHLSTVPLMGRTLSVRPSKQLTILDVPAPYTLPDGSLSFKDYSTCRENRYVNAAKASKNRIYAPSCTLHYWNCPPTFQAKDLREIFTTSGALPPERVAAFPHPGDKSASGLVEWNSIEAAVTGLVLANHRPIPYPEGRYPFILKLSFSMTPVHERAYSGHRTPDAVNRG